MVILIHKLFVDKTSFVIKALLLWLQNE